MSDFDLVIAGSVVLPTHVAAGGFVAIRDGRVVQVGVGPAPAARERLNFGPEAFVLSGAIDGQTHTLSQPDNEGFDWSTRAAAAGGVTTIVDMPYDAGRLVSTADRFAAKRAEVERDARVDVALYATVHPRDGTRHIAELVGAGACAFKFSTFCTDPERFPRVPPNVLYDCFAALAPFGLVAGVHNEDDESVRAEIAKVLATGRTDALAHAASRPPYTEMLATAQVYETGAATGCRAHVVHCSLGRGYDLAADYRARGYAATIEACLHYLVLGDEDLQRLRGFGKFNPPVRGTLERESIWRHLAADRVTLVSTDHVSWSRDRKDRPDMLACASGGPALEVLVPLLMTECMRRGLGPLPVPRLLARAPAELFSLTHVKGALDAGRDADVTVLVPRRSTYSPGASGHSIADWSPYEGRVLDYAVEGTWLRGRCVFDGRDVLAGGGFGRFVAARGSAGHAGPAT